MPERAAIGLAGLCFVAGAVLMAFVANAWALALACALFAAFIVLGAVALLRPSRLDAGPEADS